MFSVLWFLPELDGEEEDLADDWDVECSLHSH